ncbi:hypothetical protein [Pseudemcibacter aquimaris]|uniref:DUF7793 family protein n=1 Tax=Pseudemcibacter aquimaris TaxID=2857064 RepID=UPI0020122335|nr:hypothetical protein [Pseudemcibacter aquimaris]MCC3859647.1 hypothetical protein [Pseudemcibacter aquimaris]WDU60042.1 hypothetical protein KW060_07200 [Pseudemcibacter aquimaris]
MLEGYEQPDEMPSINVDEQGIVHADFGTIPITAAHIVYCVQKQKEISDLGRWPVMLTGEVAHNIDGDVSRIGSTPWVADATSALAIITEKKITRILANFFMKIQKNPYPTKLFDSREEAYEWLKKFTTE